MHKEPVCVSYTTMTIARKFKFAEKEVGSKPIVYLPPEVRKGEDMRLGGKGSLGFHIKPPQICVDFHP